MREAIMERMLLGMLTVLGSAGAVAAGEVGTFYQGRTIELYVGSSPASVYTRDARLVASHLGRHIPGKPNIIVKNMPGASGIKSANFLYGVADRDGSKMAVFNKSMALYEATKLQGVRFKAVEFNWIGSSLPGRRFRPETAAIIGHPARWCRHRGRRQAAV